MRVEVRDHVASAAVVSLVAIAFLRPTGAHAQAPAAAHVATSDGTAPPAAPEWSLGLAVGSLAIASALAAPALIVELDACFSLPHGHTDVWAPGALLVNAAAFGVAAMAFAIADITRGHAARTRLAPNGDLVAAGVLTLIGAGALFAAALGTELGVTCYEFDTSSCDTDKTLAVPALLGHGVAMAVVGIGLVLAGLRAPVLSRVDVAGGPGDIGASLRVRL